MPGEVFFLNGSNTGPGATLNFLRLKQLKKSDWLCESEVTEKRQAEDNPAAETNLLFYRVAG
jgi:hypothetical protein